MQLVNLIFYSWFTDILKLDINFISCFAFLKLSWKPFYHFLLNPIWQELYSSRLFLSLDTSFLILKCLLVGMHIEAMSVFITGKTDRLNCKKHCQDLNIKTVLLLIYKEFVTISKFKISNVTKTQTSLSI